MRALPITFTKHKSTGSQSHVNRFRAPFHSDYPGRPGGAGRLRGGDPGACPAGPAGRGGDGDATEVVVTGSRIQQSIAQSTQPISVISSADIEKTGLATVGDLLQQLTTGGAALNTKFNSSGNFGYPPDGGGIGAGSEQVDLRNLDAKRTLVLVDGLRWVNESSASGVSGSADLSTIPIEIVDRIEILEDGASSIYGSDAIAGVVNIITKKKVQGVELTGYEGTWNKGGQTTQASVTAGGSQRKVLGCLRRELLQPAGDQLLEMVGSRPSPSRAPALVSGRRRPRRAARLSAIPASSCRTTARARPISPISTT